MMLFPARSGSNSSTAETERLLADEASREDSNGECCSCCGYWNCFNSGSDVQARVVTPAPPGRGTLTPRRSYGTVNVPVQNTPRGSVHRLGYEHISGEHRPAAATQGMSNGGYQNPNFVEGATGGVDYNNPSNEFSSMAPATPPPSLANNSPRNTQTSPRGGLDWSRLVQAVTPPFSSPSRLRADSGLLSRSTPSIQEEVTPIEDTQENRDSGSPRSRGNVSPPNQNGGEEVRADVHA